MKVYEWNSSLVAGQEAEKYLDAEFRRRYHVRVGMGDIDRILVHQVTGATYRADYKNDRIGGSTDKLAVEVQSVLGDTRLEARGWVLKGAVDVYVYWLKTVDTVYIVPGPSLLDVLPQIRAQFQLKATSSNKNGTRWQTQFYAVPILWLTHKLPDIQMWQPYYGDLEIRWTPKG